MADKGFNLKVLIPTNDGFSISEYGLEKSKYYLMYNISNRSYQLAGKIKVSELADNNSISDNLEELVLKEKIDKVIESKDFPNSEINEILNQLIDIIDKKTS
jgi:hypothetical protein